MFQQLLGRIARKLDARHLPYMIVGGQAVLVYGEPRLTRDIDITLGVDSDHWRDIVEMIESLGWRLEVKDPESFVRDTMVLPALDPESGVRIDFIFSNSSYELQALERARPTSVEGESIRFASVEDLVILKTVAGRPRDMEDVRGVMARHPNADRKYILKWLKEFEAGLEQPFAKRFESAVRAEVKSARRRRTRKPPPKKKR